MKKRVLAGFFLSVVLGTPFAVSANNKTAHAIPQLDATEDPDEEEIYPVQVEERAWILQYIHKIGCDTAALCIHCKRYVMRRLRCFLRTYVRTKKRVASR